MTPEEPEAMSLQEQAARAPDHPQAGYVDRVQRCPFQQISDRSWAVYRMADIVEINRHPDIRGAGAGCAPGGSLGAERPLIPLDIDGEEHRTFRRLLDPLFSPRQVALMEPAIRRITKGVIDDLERMGGRAEFYSAFCTPLPALFFCEVMGVPADDVPRFLSFKDDVIRPRGSSQEEILAFARNAGKTTYAYFTEVLDRRERLADPGDDLIGLLMKAELDGTRLTRNQLLDIVYLMMLAGLDTVTNSLACILAWLATHPAERDRLVADPHRIPAAVEELLRYESPVMFGSRTAARDVVINGRSFPAGTEFVASWAAANLDPAEFDDPLTVNLSRNPNRHIAFASGFHRCLGVHLARLELRVAIEELHARIPDYAPDPADPIRYTAIGVRGATHLPLVWGERHGAQAGPKPPACEAISFTAKLAALARSFTGIRFAAEISEVLDAPAIGRELARSVGAASAIPPANVPFVEARYRSLESAIRRSGVTQVLEFASGVSFRGLAMTLDTPGLTYVETDLPTITAEKLELFDRLEKQTGFVRPPRYRIMEADMLSWETIEPVIAHLDPDKPVVVIYEGVFMYLSASEKSVAAANVRRILERFGGVWITPDFSPADSLAWLYEGVDPGYRRAMAAIADRTGRDFTGRLFESEADAEVFCRQAGFDVEARPQLDGSFRMTTAAVRVEDAMAQSLKLWHMTLPVARADH